MRRGEVWTASGGPDYAGKPRPVAIVQSDDFEYSSSITVCGFTTSDADVVLTRLLVEPTELNGLRSPSRLMIDKMTTLPKSKMGARIGRLSDEDVLRLDRALLVFLGLARGRRTG